MASNKQDRYLKKRGTIWWFERRVPKDLQKLIGKTLYRVSLHTSDKVLATKRRNDILDQWDRLLGESANAKYMSTLEHLRGLSVLELEARRDEIQDEVDLQTQGLGVDIQKELPHLAIEITAAKQALGEIHETPRVFAYTWRQSLTDFKATDLYQNLSDSSKDNYEAAVRDWLNLSSQEYVDSVEKHHVILWLDDLISLRDLGIKRRKTLCQCLGRLWKWAEARRKFKATSMNPFADIDHKESGGNNVVVPYDEIPDSMFSSVMDALDPDDQLPALLCRFMGWRVNEPWTVSHEKVDGYDCLRGGSKTEDGRNRLVPIPKLIQPQVMEWIDGGRPLSLSENAKVPHRAWGRKFNKKCANFNTDGRNISSHSCRVTFITNVYNRLKSVGGDLDTDTKLGWVVGHANNKKRSQSQEYHRGYPIETLIEVVEAGSYFSGSSSVFEASLGKSALKVSGS